MNIKELIATMIAPVYLRLHEGCDPSLHPYRNAGILTTSLGAGSQHVVRGPRAELATWRR